MSSLRSNFSVTLASLRMRLTTITRYPGQLVMDVIIPVIFAAMPILLGQASAGTNAGSVFSANTGTSNYIAYMLIGACTFTIISNAFWHTAYWLRWEQESGTLEALYLAPVHRLWVVAGTSLYSCLRGLFSAVAAYLVGSLLLRVDPFQGQALLALVFILVGLVPLYSLTLLFGAVVLKVKEANALVGVMQWLVSFLMGIFFPIAVFPPLLKLLALLFPPTWMTNGVRASMLGVGFFFKSWYMDLAVLWGFLLVTPYLGYWVFTRTEREIRRNEGVGQF